MELTMASQDDATPWAVPRPPSPSSGDPSPSPPPPPLPGRAYFSALGVVRRKPSRGDAPATLSKSCSDKLALRQCVSLLSSAAGLLVSPRHAYASTLVLPASQFAAPACLRAFSAQGRMGPAAAAAGSGGGWPGGYSFRPFAVRTADREFAFSKRSVTSAAAAAAAAARNRTGGAPPGITSSNLAVAWTMAPSISISTSTSTSASPSADTTGNVESTLSGILQGRRPADGLRGASFASRRRLWGLAAEVAGCLHFHLHLHLQNQNQIRTALGPPPRQKKKNKRGEVRGEGGQEKAEEGTTTATTTTTTYGLLKDSAVLGPRRRVKEEVRREALRGWVRNAGDEEFVL